MLSSSLRAAALSHSGEERARLLRHGSGAPGLQETVCENEVACTDMRYRATAADGNGRSSGGVGECMSAAEACVRQLQHSFAGPCAYCAFISRSSTVFVVCSSRSASVDFPWSMCAMMQKFRMRLGSYTP
jgi:hypothetical protein